MARSVKTAGPRVVVYNALPWPRSGMAEIPSQPGKFIYAEDVPANGYKTYPATSGTGILPVEQKHVGQAGKPDIRLDTPFYRVAFDLRRGGIASLVEKKTGRELVDRTSPYALGQFLHERFSNQQMADFTRAYARRLELCPRRPAGGCQACRADPAGLDLAVEQTGNADIATLTATDTLGLAQGIALVVTLPHAEPWVDVEWRVTEKTPDPVPEGGWLCFPLAVKSTALHAGTAGRTDRSGQGDRSGREQGLLLPEHGTLRSAATIQAAWGSAPSTRPA